MKKRRFFYKNVDEKEEKEKEEAIEIKRRDWYRKINDTRDTNIIARSRATENSGESETLAKQRRDMRATHTPHATPSSVRLPFTFSGENSVF